MSPLELAPLVALGGALAAYLTGVGQLRRRGDRWPLGRLLGMAAGSLCVALALLPPIATSDERFVVHVGQHLLLGMLGPLLMALSGPVTLVLRCSRPTLRRRLVRLLHSRALAVLTAPPTVVLLQAGGLAGVYLTPVFGLLEDHPLLHAAVHAHALLAGLLLSSLLVGVDPVRPRLGVTGRLGTLVVVAAGHDVVTKAMYARGLPSGAGPLGERLAGAQLMYYGGTVLDVVLAILVMARWYNRTGRTGRALPDHRSGPNGDRRRRTRPRRRPAPRPTPGW